MRLNTKRSYVLALIMLASVLLLCPTAFRLSSQRRRMGWAVGQGESVRHALARWEQGFPYCRITEHNVYTSTHPVATSIEIFFSCTNR